MKKLKKPAVLALLAVVLLSCVPERVQAGAVTIIQKDKHTVPEQHGESVFDNEDTLHVTCNSNRVEYRTEKDWLGYNIYAEKPFDYCAVRAEGIQEVMDNYENAVYILMISDGPIDYYQVRDGEYDYLYNKSRTTFSGGKRTGCDGREYYVYYGYLKTATNQFWYNCPETPDAAPLYMPPVISVPTDIKTQEEMCQAVLDRLITGDFSDCRVSEGDADNPAQNAPGGIPGSEENPVYDKELGQLQILSSDIHHKNDIWSVISGTEDIYDNIRWKKKTTTGFNVADNDYPFCRVQVKIKCEINKNEGVAPDGIHAGDSKPFKYSMKEEYMYKPLPKASSQLLTVAYSDISLSYFPKLMEEYRKEKPLIDSFDTSTMKLHYYLRVIVSDSLTVVPGQKSWKCGDWVNVTTELSDKGGASSEPGHFDEDGDWVSDGDSEEVDRVITSGDETGDEASEKQDEKRKEEKEKFDTDDIKSLLSQVGDFPKLIKKLFSFLPSWCLALYAFGFACMIVLLVIKTIRG